MAKVSRRVLIVGGGILVVAALVVVNIVRPKSGRGVEVRVETIAPRRIEAWVRAPGKIQPVTKVQISSNVMGRVAEIAVQEGQRVRAGDLLLRLDDERYRSAVNQYRAQIDAGVAQESLAVAQERQAIQDRDRAEKLATQGLSSDQALQTARTDASVAGARVAAAVEEVRRARAALAEVDKDLRETVFTAPMDGVVTELNIKVGENVVTGTMNNPGTVILTLSDLAAMEVVANVDETDVVNVQPGQRSRVLVDALPDTSFEGTVTRVGESGKIQSTAAQQVTNFEVAVLLRDPPPVLRPGMNADVEILTGTADSTLAVPLQALTARSPAVVDRWKSIRAGKVKKGSAASTADLDTSGAEARNLVEGVFLWDHGKARFVPVALGLRSTTHVQVRGDVRNGEELIIGPYKTLRTLADQDPVKREKKKGGEKATAAAAPEGRSGT